VICNIPNKFRDQALSINWRRRRRRSITKFHRSWKELVLAALSPQTPKRPPSPWARAPISCNKSFKIKPKKNYQSRIKMSYQWGLEYELHGGDRGDFVRQFLHLLVRTEAQSNRKREKDKAIAYSLTHTVSSSSLELHWGRSCFIFQNYASEPGLNLRA